MSTATTQVTPSSTPERRSRRRGLSLVLVISFMLILIVIATGFAAFTSQEMRTSQLMYEQAETYVLAESGIDYGLFLLKHSMLVYPMSSYDADSNGSTEAVGALIDARQTSPAMEHVVVSDLAYSTTNNWMGAGRTCGSFQLSYTTSTSGSNTTVTFKSVGLIRNIPSSVTTTTATQYTGIANWSIAAQRTLYATVNLQTNPATGLTTKIQSVQVNKFYEQFR